MVTRRAERTVPARLPWEEFGEITRRLDRLIALLELREGLIGREEAISVLGPPTPAAIRELREVTEAPAVPEVTLPATPESEALDRLTVLVKETVPEALGDSLIIPFQKTIAVATQDEQDRSIPYAGIVRDVVMAFPAGCQQLVETRLIYYPAEGSRIVIVPSLDDTFIALDDFTAVFHPRKFVEAPGKLRVEWYNYDGLNTHSVPVIVTLVPTMMVAPGEFPAVVSPAAPALPAAPPPAVPVALPAVPTPEDVAKIVAVPVGVQVVPEIAAPPRVIEQPRLTLRTARASPTEVQQGGTVTISVPVAHEGPPVGPLQIAVFIVEQTTAAEIPVGIFGVLPATGGTVTESIEWRVPETAAPGVYNVRVALGGLREMFFGFRVTAKPAPPAPPLIPRLTLGEPTLAKKEWRPGETVRITLPLLVE